MINKFSCHNFRNIQAEDLEFEKINILIGPNNSGKSNFIKALTFFSEMLRTGKEDNLKSAFLNTISRNGWDHMRNKQVSDSEAINFSWEINLNGQPVRYQFSFNIQMSSIISGVMMIKSEKGVFLRLSEKAKRIEDWHLM